MTITRRDLLSPAGGLAAAAAVGTTGVTLSGHTGSPSSDGTLPAEDAFAIPAGHTYLNSAFIHPMPVVAASAVSRCLEADVTPEAVGRRCARGAGRARFATFTATPAEISLVQNTSTGENLVVSGLGVPANDGNVVADALHLDGSLVLCGELQKRGLDVRIVRPRQWRIEPRDM
ncbi:MAG: hypothetical protein ACREOF_19605 [Gemmatimonadales bacterium]